MKKIILNKANLSHLEKFRGKKKIVLCHGVFDILHYGHITHFNQAKSFGDILVVSITEDVFVNKGPDRPIFSSLVRAKTILSLDVVDFVIISKSPNSIDVLDQIKPNIYVKDDEYKNKFNIFSKNFTLEKKFLKKINCKIKFTNQIKYSSSYLANLRFNNFDDNQIMYLKKIKDKFTIEFIETVFDQIKNLTVCLIGDPIIDRYIFSSVQGTASKSPTLASIYQNHENYAGGVLAVASMLSNFGVRVNLIYYSDKTKLTNSIEKKLNKKVNLITINNKMDFFIPRIDRIVNVPRYEKLHQMYYFKSFLHNKISENDFIKKVRKFNKKSDLMLVIDFGFNFLNSKLINFINHFNFSVNVHSNSITKNYNNDSKYKNSSYSTLNFSEYLFDRRLKIGKEISQILEHVKKNEKKDNFSITLGGRGSILKKKNKVVYCPSFFTNVKDTTGSGDAYFALTSLLNKLNINEELIAFLGNVYAGLHANVIGNKSFADREELLKSVRILLS